jgi:primosomal protein N' (replication factor Y)
MIADVIIFNGPSDPLSYKLDSEKTPGIQEGQRVIVPLGRRKTFGLVYSLADETDDSLKSIDSLIDSSPLIDSVRLGLLKWMCRYYHAAPREAVGLFLPKLFTNPDQMAVYSLVGKETLENSTLVDDKSRPIMDYIVSRRKIKLSTVKSKFGIRNFYEILRKLEDAGLIKTGYRPVKRKAPIVTDVEDGQVDRQELMLNAEQEEAYREISGAVSDGKFQPYLLFGVTGSGKSELYLKLIRDCVREGKSALLLLPEIAASEELFRKIKNRLGEMVCRIHSALKPTERLRIWEEIKSGGYKVIIGPRSALFTPVMRAGIIIVDEEHDSSYKQTGSSPQYHGRDLAVILAKSLSCPVVLGSATPSVESWYNVRSGKYRLLKLNTRWDSRALPRIHPVQFEFSPVGSSISEELLKKMNEVLKNEGQVMLLLNRRGFAPTVKCGDCGFSLQCPNCSVGLVYHRSTNSLRCHLCDYHTRSIDVCPKCSGRSFQYYGVGTQKLEEEIKTAFPKTSFARLDLDSVAHGKALPKILNDFRKGRISILIGTQMIAKSFDFPHVALMGILSADSYLEFPDFRSREKTFALLLQAAGRAGRGKFPGEVIIQHSEVYKSFIENVSEDKVSEFLENELESRENLQFPPYKHLILIHIKSPNRIKGEKAVTILSDILHQHHQHYSRVFEMLGPAESPLFKVRNNYRWQFLVRTGAVFKSLEIIDYLLSLKDVKRVEKAVRISLDVDPIDML